MKRPSHAALVLLAMLLASSTVFAQKKPPSKPATPEPAPAPAPAPPSEDEKAKNEARTHFERGVELLSEEAYDPAYAEFAASRALYPTKAATKNAGICLRRLKRYDEALDMVESLLKDFPNLSEHDRSFAEKERTTLASLVGSVELRGGESGAVLAIDERERGALPIAKPLRVPAGSHVVRVFKSGFAPFEKRVDVAGGQNAVVAVKLEALARSGRLTVTEQSGKPASVVVDNVVVGKTPWDGTVALGDHTVVLRGENDLATQPAVARVGNEPVKLALAVEPLTATLRVEPTPVNALVAIDGVSVGRGIWEGRLRTGAHKLEVADEGFLPATQSLALGNNSHELSRVTLERDTTSPLWRTPIPSKIVVEGTAAGAVGPGLGGDVAGCDGCDAGPLFGARARASLGYELGLGLGFTVDGGYVWTRQSVSNRPTTLSPLPVGSSPLENGTSEHQLTARGVTLGASVFFHRGSSLRFMGRVGGGIWLANVADRRSGTFTTSISARPDGQTGQPAAYSFDPIQQERGAQYVYASPEIRVGLPLGKHAEVSFGVEGFLAFALSQPRWDPLGSRVLTGTCRTSATNDCVTDGLAVFDDGTLTQTIFVVIVPGIALRYEL